MTAEHALISGLIISCILLPVPFVIALLLKKEPGERESYMPTLVGIALVAVGIYCCIALGWGLRGTGGKSANLELAPFIFKRFLFFGGAIVCLLIAGVGGLLVAGRRDVIESATGLQWNGFLAGLLAAQAVVFFQQCNMQGVFQQYI